MSSTGFLSHSRSLKWSLLFPTLISCISFPFSFFLTVDMATACKLQVSVLARVMVEIGCCTQKEKITTSPNKTDFKKKSFSGSEILLLMPGSGFGGDVCIFYFTGGGCVHVRESKIYRDSVVFRNQCPVAQLNQHLISISTHLIA